MKESGLKSLLTLLSEDPERAGELYLHLQGKLIRYFRWNLCPAPEDLADEVLDRVARRVSGGEQIASPVSYALGVARRVLLETRPNVILVPLDDDVGAAETGPDDAELTHLEECLKRLAPESSALVLEYYSAEGGERIRVRQRMADRMGLSLNSLRNRCLRLRRSLEDCMRRRRKLSGEKRDVEP